MHWPPFSERISDKLDLVILHRRVDEKRAASGERELRVPTFRPGREDSVDRFLLGGRWHTLEQGILQPVGSVAKLLKLDGSGTFAHHHDR